MTRLALAQIDACVGDIPGNAGLVIDAVRAAAAQGADLVVTPELVLTGYPPEDLIAKAHFLDDAAEALAAVAAACTSVVAIVGFPERQGAAVYNAAAVCRDGRVEAVYRKRALPNYGVFDEERYFEPGDAPLLVRVGELAVAVSICEDVWVDAPAAEAAALGARLLVNLSASPYHAGKAAERESMLRERAARHGLTIAYCNLTGGQDELVFDGRSLVVDARGELRARALGFAPDLLVVKLADAGAGRVEPLPEADDEVYAALVTGVRDYVRKNGFADVVIGLSGGIDSALTAAIATDALGPAHVHGVAMPSPHSSQGSLDDAEALASALGIDHRVIPIGSLTGAFDDALAPHIGPDAPSVTAENLQARARGTVLMALSNAYGWLVLATGNKSELSVGYSTLYGDMVGGFAPIKDVYKTDVYRLARARNRRGAVIPEASITKPPSAELRPGQLDTDSLPPYDVLDPILRDYVERDRSVDAIAGDGAPRELVERIARLVDAAEYKRRQGPMGIKTTVRAFGKDRRMPVTNRYRG